MKVLIDAQLPRRLAHWLRTRGLLFITPGPGMAFLVATIVLQGERGLHCL